MTAAPLLVVLGGLPGTGKTTLARILARDLGAVHLRIDTIEQAVVQSSLARGSRPGRTSRPARWHPGRERRRSTPPAGVPTTWHATRAR